MEDTRFAPCAYPDASPWLVYIADEDTPGLEELYGVKESLIGVQTPIKLNAPLPVTPGKTPRLSWQDWTDDGTWLVYAVMPDEQSSVTRLYAVRFASGAPEAPIELTNGLPEGYYQGKISSDRASTSANGQAILLYQPGGDLFRVELSASGASAPLKLTLDSESVQMADWVLGSTAIAYTTTTQAFLVSPDGLSLRAAFTGYTPSLLMYPSQDGSWLSFLERETFNFYLAKAAPSEPLKKVNGVNLSDYADYSVSRDGRYVAYSASEQFAGLSEVYLVDLQTESWSRTTLLHDQALSTSDSIGGWALDSSYFVYFSDAGHDSGTKYVNVYDVTTHTTQGIYYEIGTRDYILDFSPTGFIISNQRSATERELMEVTPSGNDIRLHQNSSGDPYQRAEVARNGSAAVFCSGANNEALYYVDLRDDFNQAVALPGQGSITGDSFFASDSKGFVYYRTAPDGSRTLYWVDTTHQVLGKPVQVTREGRARTWIWQPTVQAQ